MSGTDDKPKPVPPYSGPPPQTRHRIPSEAAHGVLNAPGAFDQSWRPYPPSFDHHHDWFLVGAYSVDDHSISGLNHPRCRSENFGQFAFCYSSVCPPLPWSRYVYHVTALQLFGCYDSWGFPQEVYPCPQGIIHPLTEVLRRYLAENGRPYWPVPLPIGVGSMIFRSDKLEKPWS